MVKVGWGLLGLVLGLGLTAASATAQACPAGQRNSSGHCCAIDAMWDARYQRCQTGTRIACAGGTLPACLTAGDHYADPRSADTSLGQSQVYYRRACQGGQLQGCVALGYMALFGRGQDRNLEAATALFERACQEGHLRGCTGVAELRLYTANATTEPEATTEPGATSEPDQTLLELCERGDGRACGLATLLALEAPSASTPDRQAMVDRAKGACASGSQLACVAAAQARVVAELTPENARLASERRKAKAAPATDASGADDATNAEAALAESPAAPQTEAQKARASAEGEAEAPSDATAVAQAKAGAPAEANAEREDKSEANAEREDKSEANAEREDKPEANAEPNDQARAKAEREDKSKANAEREDKPEANAEPDDEAEVAAGPVLEASATTTAHAPAGDAALRAEVADVFHQACGAGEPYGCLYLARLRLLPGDTTATAATGARPLLATACEGGLGAACFELGHLMETGRGGPQDPSVARAPYWQGCALGHAASCDRFAALTVGRPEAEVNRSALRTALARACRSGNEARCLQLAESPVPGPPDASPPAARTPAGTQAADAARESLPETAPRATLHARAAFGIASRRVVTRMVLSPGVRVGDAGLQLRIPMLASEFSQTRDERVAGPRVRMGNLALGGTLGFALDGELTGQLRLGFTAPTASRPTPSDPRDLGPGDLDYHAASAIGGYQSHWLWAPDRFGPTVGGSLTRATELAFYRGSLDLAPLVPVRGRDNAEVVLQAGFELGFTPAPYIVAVELNGIVLTDARHINVALMPWIGLELEDDAVAFLQLVLNADENAPRDLERQVPSLGLSAGLRH